MVFQKTPDTTKIKHEEDKKKTWIRLTKRNEEYKKNGEDKKHGEYKKQEEDKNNKEQTWRRQKKH